MSSYGLDALQVRLHDIDNEMNVMASILRSMNSMETKRARNLIRGIDWDKDVIDNKNARILKIRTALFLGHNPR
ncbi:hypothetical protein FEZ47_08645 [Leuconostoc mesenteroides]|nr:hypothetical protein [Leuconostoc mesenteroides]ARR89811.1 hypothetical protein BSR26_08970 [Leuconostoc mesenteroides subsp. mesenteroides]KMY79141.1 hypothetical protein WZ81_07880 [Leuconostoc mesenteroides subsp. cremoris]MCT3051224.1 hypothetical protein [Leuconostoc mesenteroides]ORI80483.1 hypothetical protein BMS90_04840 [Leuconostoc mesenteroides subsp. mesenteroides]TLP94026.1 hypothetical protein FEZ47_08645 [Leuconostoc mesenteroides]